MCGIVGFTGTEQAAPVLLDGLKKLEYRGYDSAGIAVIGDGGICVRKTSGKISNLEALINNGRECPGTVGIGHTRWATHGAPTDINAHPHLSRNGKFAVVHNGIIENYQELREELISHGYSFISETDTEVIVQLLEMYDTGDTRTTIMRAASRLRGSYALGVLCAEEKGTIYAMREASPLILGVGSGENYFASDVTALVAHTRNIIHMEDGELARITPESMEIFDAAGNRIRKGIERITWDVQAAEKGGYEHFMLKEIMEQPAAVKAASDPRLRDGKVVFDELSIPDEELRKIDRILITACGSAYYAGCVGRYALESLCRLPVQTELASELRYSDPMMDEHTLLIAISQSGETADTIAAVKEAKRRGAKVVGIVNVVGSTVATISDDVLYTYAGPEIAVATTKGYTTQVTLLCLLAVFLADKRGSITRERYAEAVDTLSQLPSYIQEAIDLNPGIPALASKYCSSHSVFFIGRNTDSALALEGALKLKEISYLHAESYAAGELKHGTIALIENGQPVIAVCCNPSIMEKTEGNIIEVKARGAEVLAVTYRGNRNITSVADDIIFVPDLDPVFGAPAEIVPLQLFAYYVAKANGCDIDKPRNLAKSVTVE